MCFGDFDVLLEVEEEGELEFCKFPFGNWNACIIFRVSNPAFNM